MYVGNADREIKGWCTAGIREVFLSDEGPSLATLDLASREYRQYTNLFIFGFSISTLFTQYPFHIQPFNRV